MIFSNSMGRRSRWAFAANFAAATFLHAQNNTAALQQKAGAGEAGAKIELAQRAPSDNPHAPGQQVPEHVPAGLRGHYLSALKGDAQAQWHIAVRYRSGMDGMPQNPTHAMEWTRRAAEAGELNAQVTLGRAYRDGEGVGKDLVEAAKWLRAAADQGQGLAKFDLADFYLNGLGGLKRSEAEAVKLLEFSAMFSHPEAMWKLHQLHAKGVDGGAPNPAKAAEWLEKAARAGHKGALAQKQGGTSAPAAKIANAGSPPNSGSAAAATIAAEAEAKIAAAEREFDAAFMAATSRDERAKAVAKFSEATATVGFAQRLTAPQIAERVLKTLLPRMEANVGEAGAYVMAIYSQAFDQPTLTRILPANVASAVRTHAQGISAAFNARQQALGPIQSLIPKAQAGDNQAAYQIGDYLTQNHAAKDEEGALRYFKMAADRGHAPAKERILQIVGPWYTRALELQKEKQFTAALVLLKKVAEAGEPDAEFEIGTMYYYGDGVTRDFATALKWYRQAADRGMADAMAAVAWMHRDGEGTPADENEAIRWFQRAAEAGNAAAKDWVQVLSVKNPSEKAEAAYQRGTAIAGNNGDARKIEDASQWFTYAKRLGHARASAWVEEFAAPNPVEPAQREFDEGLAAYQAKNFGEALAKWTVAAEKGSAAAMFNLGAMHEGGHGAAKSYANALPWYEKAAAKKFRGAAAAVKHVASMVGFEEGLKAYEAKDFAKAMAAWQKSAELGRADSMVNIGVLYANGSGVKADARQAIAWYEKAAALGHKRAPELIEKAKAKLVGVEEIAKGDAAFDDDEYEDAVRWYEKAAELGNDDAVMKLAGLYEKGDGVDKNPRRALEWYKKAEAKGNVMAGIMVKTLESSLPLYDMMASQNEMKRLRNSIDGIATPEPSAAPKGPKSGLTVKQLRKRAPWTADEMRAALRDGAEPNTLARVLMRDKAAESFTELESLRLRNTPEGQCIENGSQLSMALAELTRPGAGTWTLEAATQAVEARRRQVGRAPKIVDSPELRAKAAAGDVAGRLALFYMPEGQRTQGELPKWDGNELREKIVAANYVPGFWFVADALRYNPDKTKNDPVRRAELLFLSAEAGEPRAMRELAMELLRTSEVAVAQNFLEAEYWFIEAAARAPEGLFEDAFANPTLELAQLDSFKQPSGGGMGSRISSADEASLRWARELIRRGGKFADVANVHLDAFELDRAKDARKKLAAFAPETALWSAAEVAKLEAAAKRGDVEAALKLGEAYATGRGMRQHDVKAAGFYRIAAEKGNTRAMRALAGHYQHGYGVKKNRAERIAWLEKAGAAGDVAAWRDAAIAWRFPNSPDGGEKPDPARAMAAYEKAATLGDGEALHHIAMMHDQGEGRPRDPVTAEGWYKKSAEAGYAPAQGRYAGLLANRKDYAGALPWYRKAVAGGFSFARHGLGEALVNTGDEKGAIEVYRVLAAESGSPQVQLELGRLLVKNGDPTGGLEWLKKVASNAERSNVYRSSATELIKETEKELSEAPARAALTKQAEAGDTNAMLQLAQKLAPTDRNKAREWAKKAADAGNAQAMLVYAGEIMATDKAAGIDWMKKSATAGNFEAKFRLGGAMMQGQEMPRDMEAGMKLVTEAADGGLLVAQFELGRVLISGGPGVTPDGARGIAYLKKAAEQRLPQAMAVLGEIYETAVGGVKRDPVEALKWYKDAHKLGLTQVNPKIQALEREVSLQMKR